MDCKNLFGSVFPNNGNNDEQSSLEHTREGDLHHRVGTIESGRGQ
jgi:hypothetical protein